MGVTRYVTDNAIHLENPVVSYREQGFAQVKVYSQPQTDLISAFAREWVYTLLAKWVNCNQDTYPLEYYHIWFSSRGVDHDSVFCARNRHTRPGMEIKSALINARVERFLADIGIKKFELRDEGLGWLGFRFIRPGFGDGYPLSRKAWGPAKNVVSCWIPIIGYDPRETITLVPGSHLKEYKKYMPSNNKFMKGEYRLADMKENMEVYNPRLDTGEAIFYHPKILHSEDVKVSNITRLNLEFRIIPV